MQVRTQQYPARLRWHKYNDRTGQAFVTYTYDPKGRLTGRAYADGTSDSFTYTPGGRLATVLADPWPICDQKSNRRKA